MNFLRVNVVLVLALLGLHNAPPDCTCAAMKLNGGWCNACNVGYLASVKIESETLFEALDAHGHDYDPARLRCETCKQAIANEGYCDRCRMGFFKGQAYLSRLTYHLAKGEPRDPAMLTCPTCQKHAERFGWCDDCKIGMIGNVAIKNKADYERVLPEFQRLLESLQMLPKCESCAVAYFTGGMCPACKKSFDSRKTNAGKSP